MAAKLRKSKPYTWRCIECNTEGEAPSRATAARAFTLHWMTLHQEVPF